MNRELKLRHGPPVPLLEGMEWWTGPPHQLAARVRADRRVMELGRWELAPGLHGSVVRRLRPRPPAWRKPVLVGSAGVLVALILLALLAGLVRSVVAVLVASWPALLGGVAAWLVFRVIRGHRAGCVGLHCPGCQR